MTTIEQDRSAARPRTGRGPAGSRPMLCFVYSPTSGHSRRAEGFLAQVLQRRQKHRAFVLQRINCVERPDLVDKLGATTIPSLVVVEGRRVRARLEGISGCKEIEELLDPWLEGQDTGATVAADARPQKPEERDGQPAGFSFVSGPQESFGRVAMGLPADLPFDRWCSIGQRISTLTDASTWWVADWAAFGEDRYGEKYRDAVAITGLGNQTLRNYAWVARRFDVSRRRDGLSFAHHAEVAALPEAEQEAWLDRAEVEDWSRNELRAELKRPRSLQAESDRERLRLDVSSDRAERWRKAADARGLELPAWLIRTADRAACN